MAEQVTMWRDERGQSHDTREGAEAADNMDALTGTIVRAVGKRASHRHIDGFRADAFSVSTAIARARPDLVEPLLEVLQRPRPEGDG